MGTQITQTSPAAVWELAARQHGVVTRGQLVALGICPAGIRHRVSRGRLHLVHRGVFAVGRPELGRVGQFQAALLACGPSAALSHGSAGELRGIRPRCDGPIEVSVRAPADPRPVGVRVHRRTTVGEGDIAHVNGIRVTSPACTLIDLATRLHPEALERAVNEADRLYLIDLELLRRAAVAKKRMPGARALLRTLDARTFTLTDSELERRLLPIVRRAGLPLPETQQRVSGFKVDFFWPTLGLVVETDGLRYHRTPAQQTRDRVRDQAHATAGLTPLRFTHAQVMYEPHSVETTLKAVAGRLQRAR